MLENWTPNIELGVLANERAPHDDPMDEFDGNYPSGMATPRTERLQEVDQLIFNARSGREVDWSKVAKLLMDIQREHNKLNQSKGLAPSAISMPIFTQWDETPEGYRRDKPGYAREATGSSSAEHEEKEMEGAGSLVARRFIYDPAGKKEVLDTVLMLLDGIHFRHDGTLMMLDGSDWTCYVRGVLFALNKIDDYERVMATIKAKNISVANSVAVPDPQEDKIMAEIKRITGQSYWVHVVEANAGRASNSTTIEGAQVKLLLTGAHFSLLSD